MFFPVLKNLPANARDKKDSDDHCRRVWQPISVFLHGKSHEPRSLAVHRVSKSWT